MEIQKHLHGKLSNNLSWKRKVEESSYCTFLITNQFFERVEMIERVLYAKNLGKPMIVIFKSNINDLVRSVFENANIIGKIEYDSITSKGDRDRILIEVKYLIKRFIRRTKKFKKPSGELIKKNHRFDKQE